MCGGTAQKVDESGNCFGLTTLTSSYGVIVDHWGNGGYHHYTHCRWFIKPTDGSQQLFLKIFNFYALGDFIIRSGNTTLLQHNRVTQTLADYAGGVGFTFESLYGKSKELQNSIWVVDIPPEGVYILFVAWDSYSDLTNQSNRIGIQKDVFVLYKGSDNLPGFTIAYATENAIKSGVLPCNSSESINLFVSGKQVLISDWMWTIFSVGGSQPRPPLGGTTVCRWNVTLMDVEKVWYTLKTFQPTGSSNESVVISDSDNNVLASFPSDAMATSFADGTTFYRYDVINDPNKVSVSSNSLQVTFTFDPATSNGFVLQIWEPPEYCVGDIVTQIKIGPSPCLTISDHTGIGASVGTINRVCRWLIAACNSSAAKTWTNNNKLLVYVQEFESSTLNTDVQLIINTARSKYSPLISEVDKGPPVMAFTQTDFIRNYESLEIQYNFGSSVAHGFKLLITTSNNIASCLNNVKNVTNLKEGTADQVSIVNTAPWDSEMMISASSNFYEVYTTSETQGITHLALNLIYPPAYCAIGRLNVVTPDGCFAVDIASKTLSLVGIQEVLILEWHSHYVEPSERVYYSNEISIQSQLVVPSLSQSGKSLILRRAAGHPSNTFVAFLMNYRGRLMLQHYNMSGVDYSKVDLSSLQPFERTTMWDDLPPYTNTAVTNNIVDAYETYSISMCRGAILYSYKKKLTNDQKRSGLDLSSGDLTIEIVRKLNVTQKTSTSFASLTQPYTTSYFGKILRSTNSCAWIYTSYSPQIDVILSLRGNNLSMENFIVTDSNFYGHAFVVREWNGDGSLVTTVDTGRIADHIRGIYVGCYGIDTQNIQLIFYAYQNRSTPSGIRTLWGNDLTKPVNPLTIDTDSCELDNNHMSIDTNRDASLTIIGAKTRHRVYFVWDPYPLDQLPLITCIYHDLDVHFGAYVQFSSFGHGGQDIIVSGIKVYVLPFNQIIKERVVLANLTQNFTKCILLHSLIEDLQFVPNRVLYSGETWKTATDNERLALAQTNDSLFIMKTSYPASSDQFSQNLRLAVISGDGQQWVSTSIETPTIQLQKCPPGSSSQTNNLFCILCKPGSYQPEEGKMSCKPCSNISYCPTGSPVELPILSRLSMPFYAEKQVFVTKRGLSMNELVSNAMILFTTTGGVPNFGGITWTFILLLLGLAIISSFQCRYFQRIRRNTTFLIGLFDPNDEHKILIKEVTEKDNRSACCCNLRCCHSFINVFRVHKTIYPTTGKPSNGVYCLVLALLVIMAGVSSVIIFLDYSQYYEESTARGLNAVRTASYQPFFSATAKVKQAVEYLEKQNLVIQITMNGFGLEDCFDLCAQQNPVESQGCYYGSLSEECDVQPNVSCHLLKNSSSCLFSWFLPNDLDINRINSFQFNLLRAYIEELIIEVYQEGQPRFQTNDKDTLQLLASSFKEIIQIPREKIHNVFYGVHRQYELVCSVRMSEQEAIVSPGIDFSVQLDWNTLESNYEQCTVSITEFFAKNEPNTVTIQFNVNPSFILNVESRNLSLSAFLISIIVLLVAVRSALIAIWACVVPPVQVLHERYNVDSRALACCFFCVECLPDPSYDDDGEELKVQY